MKHINFIRKIAWSFNRTTGMSFDDLFSEACLAYCEAELKYDSNHESTASLLTYSERYIKNSLIMFIREEKKQKHISIDEKEIPFSAKLITLIELEREEHYVVNPLLDKDVQEVLKTIFSCPEDLISEINIANWKLRTMLTKKGWTERKIWSSMKKTKQILCENQIDHILL